ncbi:peptidase, A24 family [Clostridiales bacterium oral taxon 876 str. F0540]|nr:peptidase, A24 family [Clostridiales bacterium oral taxon 876 str. F0540]
MEKVILILVTVIIYLIMFFKFGLSLVFFKSIVLTSLLLFMSFNDLKHQIIPDMLSIITLIAGLVFSFFIDISFINSILGMFIGGLILFLLALIPNALGGGDIKIMLGIGAFLGAYRTVWAVFLAFGLSSIVSILLLLFKIKGRRDYIPFGPFLALGSIIAFLVFK